MWSSLDLTGPTLTITAGNLVPWAEKVVQEQLLKDGGEPVDHEKFDEVVAVRAVSMAVRLHNGVTYVINKSKGNK